MPELIQLIQQRHSTPLLTSPAPSAEHWNQVITAACCAPDHGRLKPWQFRLIEGDGLLALGDLFVNAQQDRCLKAGIELTEQQQTRTRELPQRAPALLVVVAQVTENHKIPVIEQITACAAATQNIQLALMDLGFGCIWRTGEFAFDDTVKQGLGFAPKDEIISFLYVGTPQKQPPTREPQELSSCFEAWPTQ